MELFYAHPKNISGNIITLDKFEAQHIIKTLRKKVGDALDITDGLGKHYSGKIRELKPDLLIKYNSVKEIKWAGRKVFLAIGFIRPNRLEYVLEKCTELGVGGFYLFRSEHTNYFSDNRKRFEKILRQAIKQSNRFWLPELYLLPDFPSYLEATKEIPLKIAAIDPNSPPLNSSVKEKYNSDIAYCVGPEGGFSKHEIDLLKENNFQDISLGAYRLRAETAAIAGISVLKLLHP